MLIKIEDEIPEAKNPDWMSGFQKEIRWGMQLEKANRMARVAEMKRAENINNRKHIDGLGQRVAEIDARTYFRWAQEEDHFWDEKSNLKSFLRDNPEYKVK